MKRHPSHPSRRKAAAVITQQGIAACLFLFATCADAQGLVAFYQSGGDTVGRVKWDTFVIDSNTLVAEGPYIRYKSFKITVYGSDLPQELKVDCKTGKRGLPSEPSMYSTYPDTQSGEEVRVACLLAKRKGLIGN